MLRNYRVILAVKYPITLEWDGWKIKQHVKDVIDADTIKKQAYMFTNYYEKVFVSFLN